MQCQVTWINWIGNCILPVNYFLFNPLLAANLTEWYDNWRIQSIIMKESDITVVDSLVTVNGSIHGRSNKWMKKVRKKKQKTDSVREREKKINKRLIKPQRKGWRRCRRWRSRADVDTRCNSKPTLRNGHRSTAERRRFFFTFFLFVCKSSDLFLFYFILFFLEYFSSLSCLLLFRKINSTLLL